MTDKLNDKQRLFIAEYLIDGNATRAATAAGYSARTAHAQGSRLLSHVDVAAEIRRLKEERLAKLGITAEAVLEEWRRIGFSDLSRVIDWGTREIAIGFDDEGKRLPPAQLGDAVMVHTEWAAFATPINAADLPPDVRAAVSEVSIGKDGNIRFKLHDKLAALSKLADHMGLAVKRTELTGKDGGAIETRDLGPELVSLSKAKRDAIRAAIKTAVGNSR